MKNFQKLALGLIVAVMAIGFSAFTADFKKATKFATITYTYNNSTSSGARIPGNWTLVTEGDGGNCGTPGTVPCKVSFNSATYANISAYLTAQSFPSDAAVAFGTGVTRKTN